MAAYKYISVERRGDIFVITLQKPPENRLNVEACQELIRAYRQVEKDLGQDAEGAVILRGSDAKFFTTGLDLHERDESEVKSESEEGSESRERRPKQVGREKGRLEGFKQDQQRA